MGEVWIAGEMERKELGKNGIWQVEVWQAIGFDFRSYIRAIRWTCLSTLPSILIVVHHQQLFYLPNNVPPIIIPSVPRRCEFFRAGKQNKTSIYLSETH
jgi:hypothetical protein